MDTCVIFNPTARGNKARRFRDALGALASGCALKPTGGPRDAIRLAREAAADGFRTIVAAGGDGTLSEVVDGIAAHPDGLDRVRVGVIPLGTINVFARDLDLPLDPRKAWAGLRSARETRIDLPLAEFGGSFDQRRHFVQLAGAGLDSLAIERVDWGLKQKIGPLAYVLAGFQAFRGVQPTIEVTAGTHQVAGELVLIGNGRYYGGAIPMFPRADCRDGLFEIRVFSKVNWTALLRFGWSWLCRGCAASPGEFRLQAPSVELRCTVPIPFEADGDNIGPLPVRFTLRRQALRVALP